MAKETAEAKAAAKPAETKPVVAEQASKPAAKVVVKPAAKPVVTKSTDDFSLDHIVAPDVLQGQVAH